MTDQSEDEFNHDDDLVESKVSKYCDWLPKFGSNSCDNCLKMWTAFLNYIYVMKNIIFKHFLHLLVIGKNKI